MNGLAMMIGARLRCDVDGTPMFTLLVFNDPKVSQYVSSCDRTTMIQCLREAANRFEQQNFVARNPFYEQ